LQTELFQFGFSARDAAESISRSQPGFGARGQAFFADMGRGLSIVTRELGSQIGLSHVETGFSKAVGGASGKPSE
jgi:hypothetical protein